MRNSMHNTYENPGHNDLDLLLPWYVNGTLDADECLLLEQHLAACPECRSSVELLQGMNAAAGSDPVSAIVPPPRISELLDTIDAEEDTRATRRKYSAVAAAAAVVAVIIGSAFFVVNRTPYLQQPQVFETATTPGTAVPIEYVFLVEYAAGTSALERQKFMAEIGGTEIQPGDRPATFRVSAAVPAATAEKLNSYITQLESRDAVRFVQLIAVQLPAE